MTRLNRMNEKGIRLLEYKKEFLKDYPQIVKDSLNTAVQQLVDNDVLDANTLFLIQDENFSSSDFKEYLMENPLFKKTKEEIFNEFEVLRENLDEVLREYGLGDFITETIVHKECILANLRFAFDENFTMNYFGVDEGDAIKLMKRRGFIEKFAVLRLTAIFGPFLKDLVISKKDLKCDLSLVYYDKDINAYAIDLFFELPIDLIESENELPEACLAMRDVIDQAKIMYEEKVLS